MKRFLLAIAISTTALAQYPRVILPEAFLGGAENMKTILAAEILTVEKVSVPDIVKNIRWKNGQLSYEEVGRLIWEGGPLTVEKGPVTVPAPLAQRIKNLLRIPVVDDGSRSACGYLPTHRIRLKEEGHTLEILIISCYESFDVYRDGKRLGGRWPSHDQRESYEIIMELDTLLRENTKQPNQPRVPTRGNKP
jgi:hypothetical protein